MTNLASIWTPEMLAMADALNGELRMAGGAVRDSLIQRPVNDFDFCTPFLPEEMMKRLRGALGTQIEIIPTGIEHGTITVRFKKADVQFEITTLRRDLETDGRHAVVDFNADWKDDAARRDFTINAMMVDPKGNLYDWFGGQGDLDVGRVRFVGNAADRIREDYLRIFRWFRFAARFGMYKSETLTEILRANASGLSRISTERIWAETKKFLMCPLTDNVTHLLDRMMDTGVAEYSGLFTVAEVKQLQNNKSARALIPFIYRYQTPETRLGYLWDIAGRFIGNGTRSETILASKNRIREGSEHFNMSARERDRMLFVNTVPYGYQRREAEWDIVYNRVPKEWVAEAYRVQDLPKRTANEILDWEVPVFPVTGTDLINSGMKPGPQMGRRLALLTRLWFSTGYQYTKADLMEFSDPENHVDSLFVMSLRKDQSDV